MTNTRTLRFRTRSILILTTVVAILATVLPVYDLAQVVWKQAVGVRNTSESPAFAEWQQVHLELKEFQVEDTGPLMSIPSEDTWAENTSGRSR